MSTPPWIYGKACGYEGRLRHDLAHREIRVKELRIDRTTRDDPDHPSWQFDRRAWRAASAWLRKAERGIRSGTLREPTCREEIRVDERVGVLAHLGILEALRIPSHQVPHPFTWGMAQAALVREIERRKYEGELCDTEGCERRVHHGRRVCLDHAA